MYLETLGTYNVGSRVCLITYHKEPDGSLRTPPKIGDVVDTIFGKVRVTALENWLTTVPKWTGGYAVEFLT